MYIYAYTNTLFFYFFYPFHPLVNHHVSYQVAILGSRFQPHACRQWFDINHTSFYANPPFILNTNGDLQTFFGTMRWGCFILGRWIT